MNRWANGLLGERLDLVGRYVQLLTQSDCEIRIPKEIRSQIEGGTFSSNRGMRASTLLPSASTPK